MSRELRDRVDDGILVAAAHLSRLREMPLRAAIRDFQASAIENAELSVGTDDEEIWRTRIDRCHALLAIPDEVALRRRVREAREAER